MSNHHLSTAKHHHSDSEPLTLWCWIHGDHFKQTFPIEISKTKTVCHLKSAIMAESPVFFRGVDARALLLYKVSIVDGAKDTEKTLNGLTLHHEEPLHPQLTLSHVFPDAPHENYIHIIVKVAILASESHSNLIPCGVSDSAFLMT